MVKKGELRILAKKIFEDALKKTKLYDTFNKAVATKPTYDKNTDYIDSTNGSTTQSNYKGTTEYDQVRNDKIASEGITDYSPTSQYADDALQKGMLNYITAGDTPSFDYDSFKENKPTYDNDIYTQRIDEMLNKVLNRDGFSYDAENDPLYQQYKTRYNREGDRSMRDTLAEVASGAGGMNSYAVTAAQQANDYYASQLGDKIPELQQLAYSMYLQDIDNQVRDLGLLQQMDDIQYNRYRDTMADWRNDRDFTYGSYRDNVGDNQWNKTFDYNAGRDSIADQRYDQEWEYNVGRDQIGDSRYESEDAYNRALQLLSAGVTPNSSLLAAAGITEAEAKAYIKNIKRAKASSGGGSTKKASTAGFSLDNLRAITDEAEAYEYLRQNGMNEAEKRYYMDYWLDYRENNPVVENPANMQSVIDLGFGQLSVDDLIRLEEEGKVISYVQNGETYFKHAAGKNAAPALRANRLR